MAEHVWEIVDNNYNKTPSSSMLEVMVFFRSAADRCGLFSKIKALYGITEVQGDDYYQGISLVADYTNTCAYLMVDLTIRHYGYEVMTGRLIDEYNRQLLHGQICCEENEIFYKKKVSWADDASTETLQDIVFKAFDEVVSEQVILERFVDEHLQNLKDGRRV